MQIPLFSTAQMIRRYRWLSPSLVFLLLWGAMVFALHTHHHHHDELTGEDSECQICVYGALSGSSVPETGNDLPAIVSLSPVSEILPQILYIPDQVRVQEARAPPDIS
jgi:hypothetical protein